MLIYVHGFNSSALSFKAGLIARRMAELRRSEDFACPELPHRPREAMAVLEALVGSRGGGVSLIGSSLGGYYATWLAEHRGARAVLVNPAVRPYESLRSYIGGQKNLYTGAQYDFTEAHLAEMQSFDVDSITPERYLLMVETGDDVLDYRESIAKYRGCEKIVIDGGDHGFSDFELYLDKALAFCGIV